MLITLLISKFEIMKGSMLLLMALSILLINTNCSKETTLRPVNTPPLGNSTARKAPNADAGPDINLEIPKNWTPLTVIASDTDGSIEFVKWRKIAGPQAHMLETLSTYDSKVIWMEEGEYEFEVTITDNDALVDKDTVKITVSSNLKKLVIKREELERQSNDLPGISLPPEVYDNMKWVFCNYGSICEQTDDGPQPKIDYWLGGGSYFERLGDRIITLLASDDLERVIVYY